MKQKRDVENYFCHKNIASHVLLQANHYRHMIDNVYDSRRRLTDNHVDGLASPMCFCRHTCEDIELKAELLCAEDT